MNSNTTSPTLPSAVQAVLELFKGPLADLRFPDVDADTLATAETEVEQRRAELQRALEVVHVARTELEQAQAALSDQARRAHAYAKVFAEGDPELLATLTEINPSERPAAPKKRGRPAKQKPRNQTSLSVANDAA